MSGRDFHTLHSMLNRWIPQFPPARERVFQRHTGKANRVTLRLTYILDLFFIVAIGGGSLGVPPRTWAVGFFLAAIIGISVPFAALIVSFTNKDSFDLYHQGISAAVMLAITVSCSAILPSSTYDTIAWWFWVPILTSNAARTASASSLYRLRTSHALVVLPFCGLLLFASVFWAILTNPIHPTIIATMLFTWALTFGIIPFVIVRLRYQECQQRRAYLIQLDKERERRSLKTALEHALSNTDARTQSQTSIDTSSPLQKALSQLKRVVFSNEDVPAWQRDALEKAIQLLTAEDLNDPVPRMLAQEKIDDDTRDMLLQHVSTQHMPRGVDDITSRAKASTAELEVPPASPTETPRRIPTHLGGSMLPIREDMAMLADIDAVKIRLDESIEGDELVQGAHTFGFDLFALHEKTKGRAMWPMFLFWFKRFRLFDVCCTTKDKLRAAVGAVEHEYLESTQYHNRLHAADVIHFCGVLLESLRANHPGLISSLDVLAVLLAALTHDVGHFGLNNQHLVGIRHRLAERYNDMSPLENYHACRGWHLLTCPAIDLLGSLPPEQIASVRQVFVGCILATDMAHHFELVNRFKTCMASEKFLQPRSDVLLVLKLLMKCADLSNVTKPPPLNRRWAELLSEEMFVQGDKEESLRMPVMVHMDRKRAHLAKGQVGFIDFMAVGLFKAWTAFTHTDFITNQLEANLDMWRKEAASAPSSARSKQFHASQPVLPVQEAASDDDDD